MEFRVVAETIDSRNTFYCDIKSLEGTIVEAVKNGFVITSISVREF